MATDRYDILGPISSGGLGTVCKGRDTQLNRLVAIKRLKPLQDGKKPNPKEEQKLLHEASLTGAIQHPNIVSVYDGGIDAEGAYLVMEYVDGETLTEVFQQGTLTPPDFIEMTRQILDGLMAAQDLGLLHRDLKPGNIMVSWLPSGNYRVKILDFGMAKYAPVPLHQTEDHNKAIYGTIHFMAPEQFKRQPLDKRTDLYALACILYLGLTGLMPFRGDSPSEIMKAHLQARVIPVHMIRRDLPRPLGEWLMMMLSRDAEDRPVDAAHALEIFQHAIALGDQSLHEDVDAPMETIPLQAAG